MTQPENRPPGEHINFPDVAWPEPVPASVHNSDQWAKFASMAPEALDGTPSPAPAAPAPMPIEMIEPRHAKLAHYLPSTGAVFWFAVSAWLTYLLVSAGVMP